MQPTLHVTHLLKLLDKMYKYVMDPGNQNCKRYRVDMRCGMDGRTDGVKPIYGGGWRGYYSNDPKPDLWCYLMSLAQNDLISLFKRCRRLNVLNISVLGWVLCGVFLMNFTHSLQMMIMNWQSNPKIWLTVHINPARTMIHCWPWVRNGAKPVPKPMLIYQ